MDSTITAAAAYELVQDALLTPQQRIKLVLDALPVLGKDDVDMDEPCPICLMPLSAVFAEGDEMLAKEQGEGGEEELEIIITGVTKLVGCGHVFCRRDLTEWITSHHGSCPTCRHAFLNIRPPSESDDESSDGGEYIPNPDDLEDEDEDVYLDGVDDADMDDFHVQGMDLDIDEIWAAHTGHRRDVDDDVNADADAEMDGDEDGGSEWGLTDGESESMTSSDGDMTVDESKDGEDEANNAALETEVNVSVHEDDEDLNVEEGQGLIPHDLVSDSQGPK